MAFTHVHIGAGKFGLGMVLDICRQAGFRSLLLNRASTELRHQLLLRNQNYTLVYDNDRSSTTPIAVDVRHWRGSNDEEALAAIADPSVVLLTTSVTPPGMKAIANLISTALVRRRRNNAPPICILACENLSRNSARLERYVIGHIDENSDSLNRNWIFCNNLVDRICSEIRPVDGAIELHVERYHEWIVEQPAEHLDALRTLAQAWLIKLASTADQFRLYEIRKYWCLNALQLAAAAYAYRFDSNVVLLADALAHKDLLNKTKALQPELILACLHRARSVTNDNQFSEEALTQYSDEVLRRLMANQTDEIGRLLKHAEPERVSAVISQPITANTEMLASQLLNLLRLPGLHEFLPKVIDRIVGPQLELIELHKELGIDSRRLQLDDALQSVVVATEQYLTRLLNDVSGLVADRADS